MSNDNNRVVSEIERMDNALLSEAIAEAEYKEIMLENTTTLGVSGVAKLASNSDYLSKLRREYEKRTT